MRCDDQYYSLHIFMFLWDFYFEFAMRAAGCKALNTLRPSCRRSLTFTSMIDISRSAWVWSKCRPPHEKPETIGLMLKNFHISSSYLLSWKYYGLDLTFVVHCMMCGMHKNVPHVYFVISCSQMLRNKQTEWTSERYRRKKTHATQQQQRQANTTLKTPGSQMHSVKPRVDSVVSCFAFIPLLQNMSYNINADHCWELIFLPVRYFRGHVFKCLGHSCWHCDMCNRN